jgi:hypothetical protein
MKRWAGYPRITNEPVKQYLLSLIVALTLLAAGCSSLATSPNAVTTAVFTPASIETPNATNTLEPIVTPTAIAKTPIATLDVAETSTAIAKAVVAASQPKIHASYLSPDKKWRAEVIFYACVKVWGAGENAYEQLKLIEASSGIEKIVDSQLQYCGGVGAYGLGGLFWSPNSRYFYYTSAREGVPNGCGYWERPVIRFDTVNRSLAYLGGGPVSPDKTKIATWQEHKIVVWDLDQGEIARASAIAPTATVGPLTWSPDSGALVYVQTTFNCFPLGKTYVVRLDLPELTSTLLLESEAPSFNGVIWDAPNRLRLFDEQGKEWRYNFVTKELEPE